jgi:hypothetical protein
VFYAPVASVFVAAGTVLALVFTSVVTCYVCVVSETCMNGCLAKWITPCMAPLFRRLESVYRAFLSNGLFQILVPTTCFNKPLSSSGHPLLLKIFRLLGGTPNYIPVFKMTRLLVSTLRQICQAHTIIHYFLKTHFNIIIIFQYMSTKYFKWSLSFRFCNENCLRIFHLSYACSIQLIFLDLITSINFLKSTRH